MQTTELLVVWGTTEATSKMHGRQDKRKRHHRWRDAFHDKRLRRHALPKSGAAHSRTWLS